MIGPVFRLEMIRATRRGWLARLRLSYTLFLGLEAALWLLLAFSRLNPITGPKPLPDELGSLISLAMNALAWQQIVVLLLATPPFVAGSITDEKTTGTLDHLLTAPLDDRHIVIGKWVAAIAQMAVLVLPAFPLMAGLAGLVGMPPSEMVAWLLWPLLPLPTMAAGALAVSALSARTAPAIVAYYFLLVPATFAMARTGPSLWWLAPAPLLLLIATLALRRMYLLLAGGPQRARGLPPVEGAAVRWKERVLGGWWVPGWMGQLVVVAGTLLLHGLVLGSLPQHEWWGGVAVVSVVFAVLSGLLVAIRAAVSVSGERERKTWESLLLIPPTTEQILRGKLWGLLDSAWPYQRAYLLAALPGAILSGLAGVVAIGFLWCAGWLLMYFTAAAGLDASTRVDGSWRALVMTLFESVRTVFERSLFAALPMAGLGGMIGFILGVPILLAGVAGVGALVILLLAHAEERIEMACIWVSQHERVPQGSERFVKPI